MTKKRLSYYEALSVVEEFMKKSGIRDYCGKVCKGHCCGIPRGVENARKYVGNGIRCSTGCDEDNRKLTCSVFMCHPLLRIIFTEGQAHKYHDLKERIEEMMRNKDEHEYYGKVDTEAIRRFSIQKKMVTAVTKIDKRKILVKLAAVEDLAEKRERTRRKHGKEDAI